MYVLHANKVWPLHICMNFNLNACMEDWIRVASVLSNVWATYRDSWSVILLKLMLKCSILAILSTLGYKAWAVFLICPCKSQWGLINTFWWHYCSSRSIIMKFRPTSLAIYQVIFWSYSDYLKYSPHKPAIWVTAAVNCTVKHQPDSWPPSFSIGNHAWNQ